MTRHETQSGGLNRRAIPTSAREGWWTAPDGAAIRRIDWRHSGGPARGSLLFLPGRGDFYEKYLETLDYWHGSGWNVTAVDWRGQAFSGRMGRDAITGHIDDFGTWIGDLADFWHDWTSDTCAPHVIVAHSMGGHIALRALAERRIAPVAAVLSAPMLGLMPDAVPRGILHAAASLMCRLRGDDAPAWKGGEKPRRMPEDRIDLLTHDDARFADEIWWRKERPELSLGPPSWGWIERALASSARLDEPGYLDAVDVPMLVFAARADRLVSFRAIKRAASRIRTATLVTFGAEARHELLRETDDVRDAVIAQIDAFFDEAAPPLGEAA